MPNQGTPVEETYEALIRTLEERRPVVADAVRSASSYRLQDGTLYLRYPLLEGNLTAKVLRNPEYKPILDQAGTELGIRVALE
jgi:hypothetical protein